jgi:hypothetical protein
MKVDNQDDPASFDISLEFSAAPSLEPVHHSRSGPILEGSSYSYIMMILARISYQKVWLDYIWTSQLIINVWSALSVFVPSVSVRAEVEIRDASTELFHHTAELSITWAFY